MTAISYTRAQSGLSKRGEKNAEEGKDMLDKLAKVLHNQYDEKHNPEGVGESLVSCFRCFDMLRLKYIEVVCGIADNSLCRKELVDFFNTQGRLNLEPRDLTYADRLFSSERLIKALKRLINDVPDGLHSKEDWIAPLIPVEDKHIFIGSGATGILDALFYALCDPGDGVLISVPYYNAFDSDLVTRDNAQIVPVNTRIPEASVKGEEPLYAFSEDTVKDYEEAYRKAQRDGISVRVVLVCNPHNPSGAIYPRETIVALAAFAAKHDLHLVLDEIYARSVFPTGDVQQPTQFFSVLGIDCKKEAGLDLSRVHIVSGASKDFSINGFRLGLFITQHNDTLMKALIATCSFAQSASPASQLWAALLNDEKFLDWYLATNRSRLTKTYDYVTDFWKHHRVPYVAGNAGHFMLIDLRQFLRPKDDTLQASTDAEAELSGRFIDNGVFVAPGAQYHHPIPGFFRFTFSLDSVALKVGLGRLEKTLGLEPWIEKQSSPDYS